MPTSELSDALNPNFYQTRRSSHASTNDITPASSQTQYDLPVSAPITNSGSQQPPQFTPHRSELEDAINPVLIPPVVNAQRNLPQSSRQPSAEPIKFLKDILSAFAAHRDATEVELKRRSAWEQDHEARCMQRQTEMEDRLHAMKQEIDYLRAHINTAPVRINENHSLHPPVSEPDPSWTPQTISGDSHRSFSDSEAESTSQPEFIEGSSTSNIYNRFSGENNPLKRKRPRLDPAIINNDGDPMGVQILPPFGMKIQMNLLSKYKSQPHTIHTAMRNHILRVMDLEHDRELPDSFVDGEAYHVDKPVRFVWDKTSRQSAHNGKMKRRVVADMLANKDIYPLVPDHGFTEPVLDSAFEQAFTTLRQKYRSQRDSFAAMSARERDEMKTRRARRLARKKGKLTKRISTRKDFTEYSLGIFDGAFQMECMSSEESSEDEDFDEASSDEEKEPRSTFLRIRYLAWRSSRLHKLFQILDEQHEQNRSKLPKRGAGRKDRRMGLPKDGDPLPPQGVSRWMISRKWLKEAEVRNPRLLRLLGDAMEDSGNVDWNCLESLGGGSDEELEHSIHQSSQTEEHPSQYVSPYYAGWAPGNAGYLENIANPILQ